MVTKIYQFHNVPPFCQFYKKVVLRLSEHGDVNEMETIRIVTPQLLGLVASRTCLTDLSL